MNLKDALKETEEGVVISFDVSPNAKRTEFIGYNQWRKSSGIGVKAPPKGGKANKELTKFLEETFKAEAVIISGSTATRKGVLIKRDLKSVAEILEGLFG